MPKKSSEKFQSQAELIGYLDTKNDKSIKLSPKLSIITAIVLGTIVLTLKMFLPTG